MYGKTKVSTLFKGKKHTWILYCAAFKINLWEIKATGIIHWYLMDHLDRPGYLTLMPYITFPSKKLSFPSCPKAKAQFNRTGTTWQCKSAAPLFFSDHLIVWINFLSTRLQGNRPPLSKCPINSKHKWPKHKIRVHFHTKICDLNYFDLNLSLGFFIRKRNGNFKNESFSIHFNRNSAKYMYQHYSTKKR